MSEAKRDQNQVTTLLLTDDVTGLPVPALRDASGRLLCLATSSGGGDVVGPASSTDEAIVRFDGTTGKLIQNSTVIMDNSGNITAVGNITGVAAGITITGSTASGGDIRITSTSNATKGTINLGSTTSGVFIDETAGQLNSGSSLSTVSVFGFNANARLIGAKDNGDQVATLVAIAAASNGELYGLRSNGTLASPTIVANDDTLFQFGAMGYDGTTHYPAANIDFEIDGTPGAGDMPGRIVFATTADGGSNPTDRVIIDSAGVMKPATNDGVSLGTGALSYSDLFLASGGVLNWNNGNVTVTHAANTLTFAGASSGYKFDALVSPSANDGAPLGSTTLQWSDLFLASGSVINFDNGDVTITHSSNKLDIDGGVVDFGSTPTVNGAAIYFVGGTDVALADGGTGASLTDPNADRIMFWDDSAGQVTWLTAGTGLTITDTTIAATSSATARMPLGIMMNVDNLQLGGTSPTNTTSLNGVSCSHAASLAANSYAQINYGAISTDFNFYDRNPEMNWIMDCNTGTTTGTGIYWFGDTGGTIPSQTMTAECMLVLLNVVAGTGTWYLVNANGTNTNTSMAAITATIPNNFRIIKNSTTDIKCYVNYTLKATSTTNLPSGDSGAGELILFGVDNGGADSTARQADFGFASVLVDAPT